MVNEAFKDDKEKDKEEESRRITREKAIENPVDKMARCIIPLIYLVYVGVFVAVIVLNLEWENIISEDVIDWRKCNERFSKMIKNIWDEKFQLVMVTKYTNTANVSNKISFIIYAKKINCSPISFGPPKHHDQY